MKSLLFFFLGTANPVIVLSVGNHTHAPCEEINTREVIMDKMVRECSKDASMPPSRLYNTVLNELSDSDDAPTFRLKCVHLKEK